MATTTAAPVPTRSHGTMRSQDLTITILGSHMRRAGGRVWSGGMVTLIGEFGFSTEAVRAALSRLVTRGTLERHRDGRMINYALTPRAQELLAEGDRRIFSFGRRAPVADAWTLLWHTIPEDRRVERSRLASRLRFLGFGSPPDATRDGASPRRGAGESADRPARGRRLRLDLPCPDGARVREGDPLLRRLGTGRPARPLRRVPR